MTTNSTVAVCVLLLLLAVSRAAEGRPRGGGGARKIRHDHQSQDESGRPDADFEFETTVGWPPRRSTDGAAAEDYGDGAVEDVTLDVTHRLYDARRGIVPYIVYQVRINCSIAVTTLYNYTITVNGKLLAREQPVVADCGDLPAINWSATTADQQSHRYATFKLEYSTSSTPETGQFKKRIPMLKDFTH